MIVEVVLITRQEANVIPATATEGVVVSDRLWVEYKRAWAGYKVAESRLLRDVERAMKAKREGEL